jgi:hypothetical protein
MKQNIQERINFSMPVSVSKGIVNADADVVDTPITDFDVNSMYVEGLASTDKLDLDQQILKPSGFILDYFNKSGFINWNHQSAVSPDAIIGEPVETKVNDENFFLKAKLYGWSNLAKNIYTIALNLEKDENSDRTLGWSVEGLTLELDNDLVTKMLVTNVALCFTPKNNDSYAKIVKGITLNEVKELRKGYLFNPIGSEIIDGQKTDIIYSLDFGEKQMLVTKSFDFIFRENPVLQCSSMADIQKAIITIAQGFEEGFIKKAKKDELIKILSEKAKMFRK